MVSIILFLGLVLSVQMVRLYQKNRQYKAQEETLQEELEAQQSRQEDLIEYEVYTQSQQYVEDTAKSKLGMAYSDEIFSGRKTRPGTGIPLRLEGFFDKLCARGLV